MKPIATSVLVICGKRRMSVRRERKGEAGKNVQFTLGTLSLEELSHDISIAALDPALLYLLLSKGVEEAVSVVYGEPVAEDYPKT